MGEFSGRPSDKVADLSKIGEKKINEATEKEVMVNFLRDLKKVLTNYGVEPYFDDGAIFMEIGKKPNKVSVGFDKQYPFTKKTLDKFIKVGQKK